MDLNFALVIIALTIVAIVAITYDNHKIASQAIDGITGLSNKVLSVLKGVKEHDEVENAADFERPNE